jgi:hypothetical protein
MMGAVTLKIHNPTQADNIVVGTAEAGAVRLRGQVMSSGHRPLFYKWYSNLFSVQQGIIGTALDFQAAFKVGSHVVLFTAKDVPGDGKDDLPGVQDSGMTGGAPPDAPAPCLVHVFMARMLNPPPASISRNASLTLEAEAPSQWGVPTLTTNPPGPPYTVNADYHRHNRIQFTWLFRLGSAEITRRTPTPAQMTFDQKGDGTPFVRYVWPGPLPAALVAGNSYTLVLRVEDRNNPALGDEATRAVTITN